MGLTIEVAFPPMLVLALFATQLAVKLQLLSTSQAIAFEHLV